MAGPTHRRKCGNGSPPGDQSTAPTWPFPRYDTIEGAWDLRGHFEDDIVHAYLSGQRWGSVGFLTFEAERLGAASFGLDTALIQQADPSPLNPDHPCAVPLQRGIDLRRMFCGVFIVVDLGALKMAGNETTAFQWETDLPETGLFKAKVLVALAAVILVRYIVSGVDMLTHR